MNVAIQRPVARGARDKLLAAAISIIRQKGYAATTVDELCASAAVTKGAFFHHFPSKDLLGVAAADRWSELSRQVFAAAPYHRLSDSLDRLLGYLDFRKALLSGQAADYSCLAGTMIQEVYETHPNIRTACGECIAAHAAEVRVLIVDVMKQYRVRASWTAEGVALHTQAVLQGAFILAKAQGSAKPVEESVDHLRRYLQLLFRPSNTRRKTRPRAAGRRGTQGN